MKKKELTKTIQEEIISILSETPTEEDIKRKKTDVIDTEIEKLKSDKDKLDEDNINEMARLATVIKINDIEKAKELKPQLKQQWKKDLIDQVVKAGDKGISQTDLAKAVGKIDAEGMPVQQAINPIVKLLISSGILEKGDTPPPAYANKGKEKKQKKSSKIIPEPKPEKEKEEEEDDDYFTPDPEDMKDLDTETEKKATQAAKSTKNTSGKYAKKLSPEDEEKLSKIRKGINAKIKRISSLPKTKRYQSEDFKTLKSLVNKDEVKKLFKSKGIDVKSLISGV